MPYEIVTHGGDRPYVEQRVWGPVDLTNLKAWPEIIEAMAHAGSTRFLVDVVDIDDANEALRIFLASNVRATLPPALRQAMLARPDAVEAASVWRDTNDMAGARSGVFTNRGEALTWLLEE